jgi:prolyl-tRNA synthetase
VAPHQVVIVPIPPRKGDVNDSVLPKCREVLEALRAGGVRAHLDDRDTQLPGWKYSDWEMRGVPLRMEIGPKDIEKDQCVLVRRDTREKLFTPLGGVAAKVRELLESIQVNLLERARKFTADNTTHVKTWEEFKQVMAGKRGFIVAGWCREADCEARIKEETKATTRVIPLDREAVAGACVRCGKPSPGEVLLAQAY